MAVIECTVEQAIEAMATARAMQQHVLDEYPLEYIDRLIRQFQNEPGAFMDSDYEAQRLSETITMMSIKEARILVGIKIGSLREMPN